jgi:hypothetical protein
LKGREWCSGGKKEVKHQSKGLKGKKGARFPGGKEARLHRLAGEKEGSLKNSSMICLKGKRSVWKLKKGSRDQR